MSETDPGLLRLVDGLLVPGYHGSAVAPWLARALEGGLGGVCWFDQNVAGPGPAAASAALRAHRPDVLVLSDEEGGSVSRLESAGGPAWPGNAALGRIDDVALTESVAAAMGASIAAAGVDVALAPVVDVNADPANPVIGVRSFGAEPALVARHGAAFVRGLQSRGVAACAKHFPGHGSTRTDSHLALPRVDDDLPVLRERDLAPFAAAVAAGVRTVLTAHVLYPSVDGEPATMSRAWMDLLRGELGFDGAVVSDALDMKAVSAGVGRGPAAVRALAAGVDLLCIGNPVHPERYDDEAAWHEVRDAVLAALRDGSLAPARLEEARDRVAALTAWRAQQPAPQPSTGAEHELAAGAAVRAIAVAGPVALRPDDVVLMEEGLDVAAGRSGVARVAAVLHPSPLAVPSAEAVPRSGPLVLVTDGRHGSAVTDAVRAVRADAVVVHVGPDGSLPDLEPPFVRTFGTGRLAAAAVAEVLGMDGS
jgi:beta-N-acetylhexosaminidase